MKLYFKDCDDERLDRIKDIIRKDVVVIKRGDGYKYNQQRLTNAIFTNQCATEIKYILTNDEQLLNCKEFYNKERGRWEIYFLFDEGVYLAQDITDKELREAHNITKMYCAGVFDDIPC